VKKTLPLVFLIACVHLTGPAFIQGPQGRLYVDDGGRGSGVPVLFVHGNGASSHQWRAQLDHLRASRRAIAFDLRGMGKSDPPRNGDYSVEAMADDVDAVATRLGLRRFVLVGHSYGGAVVASYAARHPERVAGVVFADAGGNVKMSDEAAARFLQALRKDKDGVVRQWFAPILKPSRDEVREEVLASVHATPVDAFAGALSGLRGVDMGRLLASYPGPRIAIAAADVEGPSSLHVQFPDVPVKKISGAGHWLMLDQPQAFNQALDEFLHSLDAVGK
jgi:pimeloyl-ACP methyl ester carboxylesterase